MVEQKLYSDYNSDQVTSISEISHNIIIIGLQRVMEFNGILRNINFDHRFSSIVVITIYSHYIEYRHHISHILVRVGISSPLTVSQPQSN